jgi:hypothetical protein
MAYGGALTKLTEKEITLCVGLIFFGVLLRVASLDYLDASDNYNDVAYKNLYENGFSYYKYSNISTFLSMALVKTFGFSTAILKIPSIIYSALTMIGIYVGGRILNRATAVIALVLFAVSPWSIILSRVTRGYQFDCMIAALVLPFVLLSVQKTDTEALRWSALKLLVISVSIAVLATLNHRHQTLIVLLYTAAGCVSIACYWVADRRPKIVYILLLCAISVPIVVLLFYLFDYTNFQKGFVFNRYYADLFFKAYIKSPWQWFHGNDIKFGTKLLGIFFLLPAAAMMGPFRSRRRELTLLYLIFFGSVSFYCFKFVSHLHYQPSRYIYFLFPVYVTVFAASFYSLWTFLNPWRKFRVIALICIVLFFFNVRALAYAVHPRLGYRIEGITTLPIDNIGIGRFDLDEVVEFLRNELGWMPSETYVFGGRYCEYILLLDYPMDPDRYLLRTLSGDRYPYDVGKNMYVESTYFGYHGLELATSQHGAGYLVTQDEYIEDNEANRIQDLGSKKFDLYGKHFLFIKEIHGTRIYRWASGS